MTLIEVGFTNLELSIQVERKTQKYDLIANQLSISYKCEVEINYI